MKKLIYVLLVSAIVFVIWDWDATAPEIQVDAPEQLGKNALVAIKITDEGKGLHSVRVTLRQEGNQEELLAQEFARSLIGFGADSERDVSVSFAVRDWLADAVLKDGPFELEVVAVGQPNLGLFSPESFEQFSLQLDTKPPRVSVLSKQHYIRQGGAEAVTYRLFEEGVLSGVQLGERSFRGYPVEGDSGRYIALFALDCYEALEVPMHVWAEDAAGNRTEVGFWIKALPREFRKRQINITDSFIQKVTPEIVAYSPEISGGETLQETFLTVNRDLRAINNQRIVELTKESASRILWNEPFKQLTNSKVEAVFADRRSYFYKGEKCDEQTHLGFDLASLARSPVEASNAGSVVYADYLGIYGNTVIIDHGLGLFSLYGHLSSLEVAVGEQVVKGQALGLTGQTGLAGGDHLHFSMILQGVQITPIEWWDESWVQLHVLSKLDYSDSAVAQ